MGEIGVVPVLTVIAELAEDKILALLVEQEYPRYHLSSMRSGTSERVVGQI